MFGAGEAAGAAARRRGAEPARCRRRLRQLAKTSRQHGEQQQRSERPLHVLENIRISSRS